MKVQNRTLEKSRPSGGSRAGKKQWKILCYYEDESQDFPEAVQ